MKLEGNILERIDEIFDPKDLLSSASHRLRLAKETTPTDYHNPCHDLFRIYTFRLMRELSKQFEMIVIYRDLQATLEIPIEKARKLIQENASLIRSSKVPFQTYYESEIFRNYIVDNPDHFVMELYHTLLHNDHNTRVRPLIYSSASMALVFPMLRAINVDVLLCMHDEKENFEIIKNLPASKEKNFPVIIYRSFSDMKNNKHLSSGERVFPVIGDSGEKIYKNFIQHGTSFQTIVEWYTKLGILDREFYLDAKNILLLELLRKKISKERKLQIIAEDLAAFLKKEGLILDLASKEIKVHLGDKKVKNILDSLNAPKRLDILVLLGTKDLSAAQIAKEIGLSLPTTIFHLKRLQEASIISKNKDRVYRLETNQFLLHV